MSALQRARGKALPRILLLIVIPVAALLVGSYFYSLGGRYVTTDNAYVKGDNVAISATIDGRVVTVEVADNQTVSAGDILFKLDARPYELKLKRANAQLDVVRNEVASLKAEHAQVLAEITNAGQRAKYFRRQRERRSKLVSRGLSTASDVDEMQHEVNQAVQQSRALEQKAQKIIAMLGGQQELKPEDHPDYLDALAVRDEVELTLEYTTVRAPANGIVSRVQLQPGEWVEEGRPVFHLIKTDDLWIEANLKETKLTHIAEGHPVTFTLDAYSDHEWEGKLLRISPATGGEFMVLPPQNATGNWVKVVQRIPVRIDIASVEDAPPLRVGMTARVEIDTGQQRELLTLMQQAMASIRGGEQPAN